MKVTITKGSAVAAWTWKAPQNDVCGICRAAFDATCPDCAYPGDGCPVRMYHVLHMLPSRIDDCYRAYDVRSQLSSGTVSKKLHWTETNGGIALHRQLDQDSQRWWILSHVPSGVCVRSSGGQHGTGTGTWTGTRTGEVKREGHSRTVPDCGSTNSRLNGMTYFFSLDAVKIRLT
jgi:hypothetical protein